MLFKDKLKSITKSEIWSFIVDITVIVLIVFTIKTFFIVPFVISWLSMYDSYYDKEFIIVDKISYSLWKPSRWDVIVFRPWVDSEKEYFLKRIIWIPWDTLKIEKGKVYVKPKDKKNFIELQEKYLSEKNKGSTYVWWQNQSKTYDIWEWKYFVMWDNRLHSTDSRHCFSNCAKRGELITEEDMTWRVLLDLWYFNFLKLEFVTTPWKHWPGWVVSYPRFFSSPSAFEYKELK